MIKELKLYKVSSTKCDIEIIFYTSNLVNCTYNELLQSKQ